MPAFKEALWKMMIALLTLVRPLNIHPAGVRAVVPASQHASGLLDVLDSNWVVDGQPWFVTLHDHVGASKQPVFIPLSTLAALPSLTTDIAKLGPHRQLCKRPSVRPSVSQSVSQSVVSIHS